MMSKTCFTMFALICALFVMKEQPIVAEAKLSHAKSNIVFQNGIYMTTGDPNAKTSDSKTAGGTTTKKDNTTMYIVIGVVALVLVCCCVGVCCFMGMCAMAATSDGDHYSEGGQRDLVHDEERILSSNNNEQPLLA